MLENITPQESHRINSDLLKCLRSCCLAFEKSCVFMQYKLMVQPLSSVTNSAKSSESVFYALSLWILGIQQVRNRDFYLLAPI